MVVRRGRGEPRHCFEFLAPSWGPVIRLQNVFHFCLVSGATSSGCAFLLVKVDDRRAETR